MAQLWTIRILHLANKCEASLYFSISIPLHVKHSNGGWRVASDCLWWINWCLRCLLGEGCILQKRLKLQAAFIFFLSRSSLVSSRSLLSENGIRGFHHADFSLTNKIPERFASVCVSETSGIVFRKAFFFPLLFLFEKRLNTPYSASTSHERWQAVYMKEECEATWADYHTPHQRALRFQLMWLAAVLHAKSVIEPVHHIPVQYDEADCHVEEIFSSTPQLEDITWPSRWLLPRPVP